MGNVAISRPRTLTNGSGEKQAQARPCTPETEASGPSSILYGARAKRNRWGSVKLVFTGVATHRLSR